MVYLHAWENTHYVGYDITLARNVGHIILMLSVKWAIMDEADSTFWKWHFMLYAFRYAMALFYDWNKCFWKLEELYFLLWLMALNEK
jgi:hypothetical protein